MASQQTTKRLICVWKGCDDVFEEAAAFKEHVDKHIHELMQTDLDNQWKDGTEEQQEEDKPLAKVNEDKMANGMDIGRRKMVFLSVEVWTDIFGFVKRIQLARISLTNLYILQICWPRLHGNKVGTKQADITIIRQEQFDQDRPKALVLTYNDNDKGPVAMPLPCCPLPSYISGFNEIIIQFLDQQVLAFFIRILPCLAKSGVSISLVFDESNAKQCALLDQLLNNFTHGLPNNKLRAHCLPFSNIHQYLPDFNNKMQILERSLCQASDIPILMKLLASPRPDGQQRVIYIMDGYEYLVLELIRTIKEDFRACTQRLAQPFYIACQMDLDLQRSAETNEQVDEQLTIMPMPMITANGPKWEICRHPRGQHEQWVMDGRKRLGSTFSNERFTQIYIELA